MSKLTTKLNNLFSMGPFKRNVAIMFSGTIISQTIYLLFYPVLTRIYSPANFGQFAIFMTFLSILSVLATGQYELTILLPKKKTDLKYLTYGTILLSIIISTLVTIVLLFSSSLLQKYGLFNTFDLIYFLGISVLINSLYQTCFYLSLRNKDFVLLSIVNIINVALGISFQFLLSKTNLKDIGLMIGYMTGTLIATILIFYKKRNLFKLDLDISDIFSNIKKQLFRYKKFPLFNLPATFVNLSANQIPQLLLNTFSQSIIGHFSLSQRVLGSPVTLFSSSIAHVFKEKASSDYRNNGSCRAIFVKTFKNLLLISIIPFILIFFLSPKLVPIIFGSEWEVTGIYIRVLTLMYFFKFTVSPLTYVIIIAEKQKLNLILQTLLLIVSTISISYGISQKSPLTSIILYSISYSVIYLLFLLISYKLSKNAE